MLCSHCPVPVKVELYCRESKSESDIASISVHRKSDLMFTLNSDKDQRNKFAFTFAFVQCNFYHCDIVNSITSLIAKSRNLK